MSILQAFREPSPSLKVAVLFALNVAIWTYAGYAIGETKGRGWRGAIIDGTCQLECKL